MKQKNTTHWKKQAQEIWSTLDRISKSQKAFDRRLKKMQEEFDRQFKKMQKEADMRKKEAAIRKKEAEKETKFLEQSMEEFNDPFTTPWDKLMESLFKVDLRRLLNERGIKIRNIASSMTGKYKGEPIEFDLIGSNRKEVVVVTVRTTLGIGDVKEFLKKLKDFKQYCLEYKNHKIYGGVAYLKVNSKADTYAKRHGLFVIKATGNSASIINNKNFKPKVF